MILGFQHSFERMRGFDSKQGLCIKICVFNSIIEVISEGRKIKRTNLPDDKCPPRLGCPVHASVGPVSEYQ